jgi:hypothetical protein
VSLRSRLTTAFLVVVLGPVLVGAVFVAAVMSHLADSRGEALADSAVTMVDSTLGTICERIQASAAAVALNYRSGGEANAVEMAKLVVDRAVVDGVVFTSLATAGSDPGTDIGAAAPEGSWVDCGETAAYAGSGPIVALGAQAEVVNVDGSTAVFSAFRIVDREFLGRLARVADADLILQDSRTELLRLVPPVEHRHRRHRRHPHVLDPRRDGHRLRDLRGRPRRLARPLDHPSPRRALGRRRTRLRRRPGRARARPRPR